MTIEVKLPELGEGVESADVAEVHVAEGDTVEVDQVLVELETEKAVMELPSEYAGIVKKINVAAGDTLSVGDVILTIEESGDGGKKSEKAEEETAEAKPKQKEKTKTKKAAAAPEEKAGVTESESTSTSAAAPAVARSMEAETDHPPAPAGPATRRMARELGVDLEEVPGSGKSGRITPEDVQDYVRRRLSAPQGPTGVQTPPLPDFSKFGPIERQPLSKIARSTAENLAAAWQTIPHVTQHDLADITELEAARKRFVESKAGQAGPKVTMTAIAVKASVAALKAFPHFNSSLDAAAGELVLKQYFHIGVAVDTPHGLLVPVIRDADRKTVLDIAGELTDLATRARDRKLALDEMQGASFTITNLGGIGGTAFTPIVNLPEVAILGLSRSRTELRPGGRRPRERLMLPLSLSYDHRVINGADAARFVAKLATSFADCFTLLIEC